MKYPFVKQEELKDCGVACLSMIIKYYKGFVPMDKLRDMTKTNKNGITAYHIVDTANRLGLKSKGIKINDLNQDIELPCIAHVTINNSYNHYVVIYKIDNNKKEVIIADPADRIKKMSFLEFKKIFNNILIIFSYNRRLPLYTKPKSLIKFTIDILKQYKKLFLKIVILSFFITLFSIMTSFYIESMINNIEKTDNSLLFKITFIFLIIYILKNILDYIRNKLLLIVNKKINLSLTSNIFHKIISLPYEYFKNRTTGEVITRITDLNIVTETIIKVILTIILDISLAIFSLIFLIKISYKLFILSIIIMLIYILTVYIFKEKLKIKLECIKEFGANLNSFIVESISGFETVKGLAIESEIINKYNKKNKELLEENYSYEKTYNMEYFLKNIFNEIGICILIFIGSILVITNEITIGNLITYNTLFLYFISPIKNIIELDKNIKESKIAFNRINEIIIERQENIIYKNLPFNNITVKKLNYSYNDIEENLNDINLTINSKERIMITGSSGSGKSTILKLIKKYYQVEKDKIFIDNIDINQISKKEIDKNITYVSQNEILFTDTLYNNLTLNRKVDIKKINEVIKDTNIDFVRGNLGLNMLIEENGFNLSGGERQRIVLARSLLNHFKILILDESLNQMDINLERKILKNIFNRYKNSIIIVVSHRFNNIDLFDKVINIEKGKIEDIKIKNN